MTDMDTKILTSLFIALVSISCAKAQDSNTPGDDNRKWTEPIRVATYNIQYDNVKEPDGAWANRKDITKAMLEKCDFDIFGAQEPYKEQVEDIASWLPEYSWVGTSVTGENDVPRRHFNPIFYKTERFEVLDSGSFWYSETPNVANSKSWDSYSPRMCNWAKFKDRKTGKVFFHFNSHFDHKGVEARRQSARILLEKVAEIAGDFPAFCTADYNSNQNSEVYKTIVTSGLLSDSYSLSFKRENEKWPTYNGYKYMSTPPANATRIDHIFITNKDNKVLSWKILTDTFKFKYPSDHNPVVIEWSFKK